MKLNESFNYTVGGNGIFHYLSSLNVPWETDAIVLDVNYHGNHSGQKMTSPLIDLMCAANDDNLLSENQKSTLANVLFAQYGLNWQKLYDTLSFEYNPIENYNMVESGTDTKDRDLTDRITGTDTHNITGSNTGTVQDSGSTSNTGTQGVTSTQNSTSKIAGFNSTDFVNDNETSGTGNSTRTDNLASTNTNTRTDNLTHTETDAIQYGKTDTIAEDETNTHRLTRSGNIGVTTSQQMIESERSLWFWNFLDYVFRDIDTVLCCDIYGDIQIKDTVSGGSSGGGSSTEIMQKLDEISSQITNGVRDITSNDNDNTTTITDAIAGSETRIKSNDDTNTANIRGDIINVTTQGY